MDVRTEFQFVQVSGLENY